MVKMCLFPSLPFLPLPLSSSSSSVLLLLLLILLAVSSVSQSAPSPQQSSGENPILLSRYGRAAVLSRYGKRAEVGEEGTEAEGEEQRPTGRQQRWILATGGGGDAAAEGEGKIINTYIDALYFGCLLESLVKL